MKHVIFTLVLFFAAGNLFAQQGPKVDTVVTEKWNGSAWVDSSRIVYTYDANCHLNKSAFPGLEYRNIGLGQFPANKLYLC
jgi:hypothetical protein